MNKLVKAKIQITEIRNGWKYFDGTRTISTNYSISCPSFNYELSPENYKKVLQLLKKLESREE